MENFDAKNYRDNLAKDLKEVRKDDPVTARELLEKRRPSSGYQAAKKIHDHEKSREKIEKQYEKMDFSLDSLEILSPEEAIDAMKGAYHFRENWKREEFANYLAKKSYSVGNKVILFPMDMTMVVKKSSPTGYSESTKIASGLSMVIKYNGRLIVPEGKSKYFPSILIPENQTKKTFDFDPIIEHAEFQDTKLKITYPRVYLTDTIGDKTKHEFYLKDLNFGKGVENPFFRVSEKKD
ncbi:MAG: hypothetical protein KBC98_00795 [Candidatus Pacebacteria bacterium]|nr:hypothetical protein [Candidatus Paceibacterota bacterium]